MKQMFQSFSGRRSETKGSLTTFSFSFWTRDIVSPKKKKKKTLMNPWRLREHLQKRSSIKSNKE